MSPETVQRIFQATDLILDVLPDNERTTLKILSQSVSEKTGLSISVVTPVVQMYVKNRSDYAIKKGRTGGIRRKLETDTKVA
jgi:hypothetical protein